MGRRKLAPGESPRNTIISVAFTPKESEQIKMAAETAGLSKSEFIRNAVLPLLDK